MLTVFSKGKTQAIVFFVFFSIAIFGGLSGFAQQNNADSLLQDATLSNVIQYALKRQFVIQQSLIDEKITDLEIKSKLADWYP